MKIKQIFINTTLKQRLARHRGHRVTIEAKGFASEAGLLISVGRRFMKVKGQFFVPSTLNQIRLLGLSPLVPPFRVFIETIYRSSFIARVFEIGIDYIELLDIHSPEKPRLLIPLNKVVRIERI